MCLCLKVGFNIEPNEATPLMEVLGTGLEKFIEPLTEISGQASKEYALEMVRIDMYSPLDEDIFVNSHLSGDLTPSLLDQVFLDNRCNGGERCFRYILSTR